MTEILLYGGPSKRSIIQDAYVECGLSYAEWDVNAEEYVVGLRGLNNLMSSLDCTDYNYPVSGDGSPEDESGLAKTDVLAVTALLAQRLAKSLGKQYAPDGTQAKAISSFRAKWQVIPERLLGRQTIRGAGNRWYGWPGPFFVTPVPSDETPQ